MREKPPKRLVSKSEYLKIQYRRLSAWYGVTVCFGMTLCGFLYVPWRMGYRALHHTFSWSTGLAGVFLFGVAIGLYYVGRFHLGIARAIEPVTFRIPAHTGHLPEVESLVRPSDLAPSHQQAELLRAARSGQETPTEELLRATVQSAGRQEPGS